jgi:alpha-ketoglutarate-dependent taurine dioxygenase
MIRFQSNLPQLPSVPELRTEMVLHGWSRVTLEPGDVTGSSMQDIVRTLGTPLTQDASGALVWHVRQQPEAEARGDAPRSWTLDEFPFHTDGSFEDPQPAWVALYCVQADRFGGGETQLKSVHEILARVSLENLQVLRTTRYRFAVPPEFRRDLPERALPIVYGPNLMRYRREQILDEGCSPRQREALAELVDAVESVQPVCFHLRSGDLLLLDNGRYLHARTAVLDPDRHLLRMRFTLDGGDSSRCR